MDKAKCTKCDKWLSSNNYLSRHIKFCHSTTPRVRFSCELCTKTFSDRTSMKTHIVIFHHGQRPYVCNLCPKSYTASTDLKRHIDSLHKGIRFTCHICGMSVTCKRYLKTHIKSIHERAHTYDCTHCDKKFSLRSNLNRHVRSLHAANEKIYRCDLGSKTFSMQNYLNIHRRRHVAQKRCKCNLCYMALHTQSELKTH